LAALTTNVAEDVPPFLGQPINVGGGDRAALSEVIALAEELTGKQAWLRPAGVQKGDVDRTEADLTRARRWLGYEPRVALPEGLRAEAEWVRQLVQVEKATR
jgi:UDP-glucose 4-epimerase